MKQIKKFSKADLEKAGVPKDLQWVITNKCNMQIENTHCAVPYSTMPELLDYDIGDTLQIIDAIATLGLEVKILGGNFSDNRQAFLSVIDRMNKRGINYAITDNAINRGTILEAINQYGVKGFVFSLDTLRSIPKYRNLPGIDIGGCSPKKSAAALQLIPKIRGEVPYVAVNHMIHAGNMEQTAKIIEYCTDELDGTIVNLCPMIHGSLTNGSGSGRNIYIFRSPTETVMPFTLQAKHKERFAALMDKIIELKDSGCTVGVPVEYLELLKENTCGKFTWNCGEVENCPILRLFPDGTFGVCSDLTGRDMQRRKLTPFDMLSNGGKIKDKRRHHRGKIHSYGFLSKLTVSDMARNFARINKAWLNDRDRLLCCQYGGCVWSNICIAWIYQQKGYGTLTATKKNL